MLTRRPEDLVKASRLTVVGVGGLVAALLALYVGPQQQLLRSLLAVNPSQLNLVLSGTSYPTAEAVAWLVLAAVASLAWCLPLAAWMRADWDQLWRSKPYRDISGNVPALIALGAGLGHASAALTRATGIAISESPKHDNWLNLAIVSTFSWIGWIFTALIAFTGAFAFRLNANRPAPELNDGAFRAWAAPKEVDGLGVSCSGGGIRSAAFTLGALAKLEERGILHKADYLSAVSGGSYAACAWTIAAYEEQHVRGGGDVAKVRESVNPFIGWTRSDNGANAADLATESDEPSSYDSRDLARYIAVRRRFLRSGQGGLPANAFSFLTAVAIQVVFLALVVFSLAWPIGSALGAEIALGSTQAKEMFDEPGLQYRWDQRLWAPAVSVALLSVPPALLRTRMFRTRRRRLADHVAVALLSASLVLASMLVGIPLAADALAPDDNPIWSAVIGALSGATVVGLLVSLIWFLFGRSIYRRVPQLGGLLLLLGALWLSGSVIVHTAAGGGPMGGTSGLRLWMGSVLLVGLIMFAVPIRRFSLFWLYRRRLQTAFATTTDLDRAPAGLKRDVFRRPPSTRPESGSRLPLHPKHEPYIVDLQGLEVVDPVSGDWTLAPKLLVCCSAQRRGRIGTGVAAMSFVISPDDFRLYMPTEQGIEVARAGSREYHDAARNTESQSGKGRSALTVSSAMAISGAAVSSAMGRYNLGSTNSLIAALNLGLGSWMLNPAYCFGNDPSDFAQGNMTYLAKEIFGWYDSEDPLLYVTDGGHYENLGLVELVRRRPEHIVCIDASDDPTPYAALYESRRLVELECKARINIEPPQALAEDSQLPDKPYAIGEIDYFDEDGTTPIGRGHLLYLKAQVSVKSSIRIKAFNAAEPKFPMYSTYDQDLRFDQFEHLYLLGREVAELGVVAMEL